MQDDFGFTMETGLGLSASTTTLLITNAGSSAGGGADQWDLDGVATVAGGFAWGEPGGSPIIIARLNDGSGRPYLMPTRPARR